MINVSIKDPRDNTHWMYKASVAWVRRHDNGAIVSCGLTVGETSSYLGKAYLSETTFDRMKKTEKKSLRAVTYDEWNHSGCQSQCILRGDSKCGW